MRHDDQALELAMSRHPLKKDEHLFFYSAYWRTWNRVISPKNAIPEVGRLDVALVPAHTNVLPDWERIRDVWIIENRAAEFHGDHYCRILPDSVLKVMRVSLPVEAIQRLLGEDILSQVDIQKLRRLSKGGCPLELCHK